MVQKVGGGGFYTGQPIIECQPWSAQRIIASLFPGGDALVKSIAESNLIDQATAHPNHSALAHILKGRELLD